MRWRNKLKPELHSYRIVSRFLWLPFSHNGETRWLEIAKIKEQYIYTMKTYKYKWYFVEFVEE